MTKPNDSDRTPHFELESSFAANCGPLIAGVDEAGRGPWAGPVVAAAVILDPAQTPAGLNDSKKLSQNDREALFEAINTKARVGIGIAQVAYIDQHNILQATMWAMAEAVTALPIKPDGVLIDGNRCPSLSCPAKAVIKGDQISLSIAAASIIAKVTRDAIMCKLAAELPGYGFDRHKGYGTKAHRDALAELGVSPHHRRSFKPIRSLLAQTS